jgi:hypothetical protein
MQAQGSAAIEKNVAGAEQQNDLVQRRIRLDVDKPKRPRADRDAHDEKYRDIGNPDFLSEQGGDGTDRQNQAARKQRVFCYFDRGGCFQFVFSLWRMAISQIIVCRRDAARRAAKWQGRRQPHNRDDNINFRHRRGSGSFSVWSREWLRAQLPNDRPEQLRRQIDRELTEREIQPGQPRQHAIRGSKHQSHVALGDHQAEGERAFAAEPAENQCCGAEQCEKTATASIANPIIFKSRYR